MANDDKRHTPSPASEPGPEPGNPEPAKATFLASKLAKTLTDQRFDMWLERQLNTMFEIDSEPGST